MDLSTITEGWREITLAGTPYRCRLLKLKEWGEAQAWLKSTVPSPVAEAARALNELQKGGDHISAEVRQEILDHAQEASRKWPPRVGSIAWIQALSEANGGTAHFIWVALTACGYPIDSEEAASIEASSTVDEIGDLIRVTLHGEPALPKSTENPTTGADSPIDTPSSPTTGEKPSLPSSEKPDGPTNKSAT